MSEVNELIRAEGLWKTFQLGKDVSVDALRGLELSIEENEFVSVIGPSGSGKSTLLNMIGALRLTSTILPRSSASTASTSPRL